MKIILRRWWVLAALIVGILAIFVVRTLLAASFRLPRLFELFDTAVGLACAVVLARGWRFLSRIDWFVGLGIGLGIGLLMPFSSLYSPYPLFDVIDNLRVQAVFRGGCACFAALGGLVIFRKGGPVKVLIVGGRVWPVLCSLGWGVLIGLPLAVLNAFANTWTQGRPFSWQSPFAAALDALQPGVFEEVVYRLACLGLFWWVLRGFWPEKQAAWLAGLLALLVHNYSHYSELFVSQPLTALAVGTLMGLVWGLPLTVLALRRDLESAVGFHWIQDAVRFWVGL